MSSILSPLPYQNFILPEPLVCFQSQKGRSPSELLQKICAAREGTSIESERQSVFHSQRKTVQVLFRGANTTGAADLPLVGSVRILVIICSVFAVSSCTMETYGWSCAVWVAENWFYFLIDYLHAVICDAYTGKVPVLYVFNLFEH